MESCKNKIDSKLCGHDAHATVFGVPMCASCINSEFQDEAIEKYIKKTRIGVVLAMKTLLGFAIRNLGKTGGLKLPRLKLPKEKPEVYRTSKLRTVEGTVKEYEIFGKGIGLIGRAKRDFKRKIWLAVSIRGDIVDVSSSLEIASVMLWEDYIRSGK